MEKERGVVTRRKVTIQFRKEASHRVIDLGQILAKWLVSSA
jgi:hypothetical protein